jgi:hypothetical protein
MVYNQNKPIRLHSLHLKLFSSYDLGNLELKTEMVFHLMCLIYEHLLFHQENLFRIQNLVLVLALVLVLVMVLSPLELVILVQLLLVLVMFLPPLELVTMVQLLQVNLLELEAKVHLYGYLYFDLLFPLVFEDPILQKHHLNLF